MLVINKNKTLTASIIVTGIIVFLIISPTEFQKRWETTFQSPRIGQISPIEARMRLVEAGMEAYRENPVFGAGFGNVLLASDQMQQTDNRVSHNTIVQVLAETGTIGFVLFGYLLLATARNFFSLSRFKNQRKDIVYMEYAFLLLFVTTLISRLISGNYIHPYWYILFAVAPKLRSIVYQEMARRPKFAYGVGHGNNAKQSA